MTQTEIDRLAARYSNSRPADEMPCNPGFARMIAADCIKWLMSDFTLVSRDYVRQKYELLRREMLSEADRDRMDADNYARIALNRARADLLRQVFGEELFKGMPT